MLQTLFCRFELKQTENINRSVTFLKDSSMCINKDLSHSNRSKMEIHRSDYFNSELNHSDTQSYSHG